MFVIEDELKKLPKKPGVYIMHDERDEIIYVGKAKNLKNRVSQYFRDNPQRTAKINKMISLISYFEYIVVDSELEALILECNLIKEHRPKYNTMLMDGKGYPFIKVTVGETFPRVMFAHEQRRDKAKYFGPYTSGEAAKKVVDMLCSAYSLRRCNKNITETPTVQRPCLYYHMKACKAPCMGYIGKEEYRRMIDEILDFFGGNTEKLSKELERKMYEASEAMEFEAAAEYRDLLADIRKLTEKQKATDTNAGDRDIIAYAKNDDSAVVQVFYIREGKMVGRDHYFMRLVEQEKGDILAGFIKQFYAGTPFIPREIFLCEEPAEIELLSEWLTQKRGQKVHIKVPQKGSKEKLVELAVKNAKLVLEQDSEKIKREEARTKGAVRGICELLGIKNIRRIESYDISNISGFESVGSMVVYEDGKPKKNDYRKFRIRSVQGPDDYGSMREMLKRRFLRAQTEEISKKDDSFTTYPELIMMDGGKGQVNCALQILDEFKLDIPVCGMVKDDNHRTRGIYFNGEELPIDTHSEEFRLITRIQDETHRFAIEYHRLLRSKTQVHSVLDEIKGVGKERRRAIMKHFASIDDVKAASVEELMKVPAMNRPAAESIYNFFRSGDKNK